MIHQGLWERIRKLESDVLGMNTLIDRQEGDHDELKAIVEVQQGAIELLTARGDMMAAHVENLIDRVADLEGTPRRPRAWEVSDDPGTHQAQG